ncbi:hypothetical protein [Nannocystis sp.]|uniref:hypothetical protein n=1 Tax=Nannocystis sp. TaxID=1962667 RepID=UPI0025E2E534|nr:hypothetical protein [Nannocystis sp.]MBK7829343.1 hypothetical protein [Nannocystis sp.]
MTPGHALGDDGLGDYRGCSLGELGRRVVGPWICNPADPRIVACDELHAVLHAP